MVFKRPKFFLDLGGGEGNDPPVVVAPPKAEPAPAETTVSPQAAEAQPGAAATAAAEASLPPVSGLTTAEAIAAELAAAEALRPAPTLATFAPDCVTAGGATPMKRRTPGANLGGFKEMAAGMMRS
ncbi:MULTISPECIES: hypothetical protein [unclassified Cyanobium]|uniref:hypothetical protein n=1 Tax=unclassified Cyanobium TaxID=2627006 RepID=UPI0020CE27D8|nr:MULTISPECIES: hypothetical protein [unclassified Cyanobium]MCP9833272.1 hypothetical protein [Cyanobium sp. La Preciosa 7G6]MCP9935865.1 hypothetical protein [Cyanobium sp. Aljojuca 7A6]